MSAEERKKIVARLLASSKSTASKIAESIKQDDGLTPETLYIRLREYVLCKYLLPENTREDGIKALARLSLEQAMTLDKRLIRELDQQTPCNHATSEATKKVLLLYALQKDLEIIPEPSVYSAATTLHELADVIYPLLAAKRAEARAQAAKEGHYEQNQEGIYALCHSAGAGSHHSDIR